MDTAESQNFQTGDRIGEMLEEMGILDTECWEWRGEQTSTVTNLAYTTVVDSNNNTIDTNQDAR